MTGRVLILGGSRRFGSHVAKAFRNAGWTVRHFHRMTDNPMTPAQGGDVIVNGWNPLYPAWAMGRMLLARHPLSMPRSTNSCPSSKPPIR